MKDLQHQSWKTSKTRWLMFYTRVEIKNFLYNSYKSLTFFKQFFDDRVSKLRTCTVEGNECSSASGRINAIRKFIFHLDQLLERVISDTSDSVEQIFFENNVNDSFEKYKFTWITHPGIENSVWLLWPLKTNNFIFIY